MKQDHANKGSSHASSDHTASLGEQTNRVVDDVRQLGTMALASAGDALHTVKDRGATALESAKEHGREAVSSAREQLTRSRDGLETYVTENPVKSMLVAAGIGALLGYSFTRRS